MIKNILKDKEKVAYQCLHNDLVNNKISHSYLFVGEYSPLKIDTAFLLAQSIIEGKNDFACEECNTCRRIKEEKYVDFRYINGYDHNIKKDEIESLMEDFYLAPTEKANKKVYIISNINYAAPKVLNMILKFIEEPLKNTYCIFIVDDENSLLNTIISRCQKVRFLTRDFTFLIDAYKDLGFDDADSYLLSSIKHCVDKDVDSYNEAFNKAKDYVYELIDNINNEKFIPVLLDEYSKSLSKESFSLSFDFYVSIFLQMLQDSICSYSINDDTYNLKLGILNKSNPEKMLNIMVKINNLMNRSYNKRLLLDKIAYEIIK